MSQSQKAETHNLLEDTFLKSSVEAGAMGRRNVSNTRSL